MKEQKRDSMLLTGASIPLVITGAGSTPWPMVAGTVIACGILTLLLNRCRKKTEPSLIRLLWAEILMGFVLTETMDCWKTELGTRLLIPAALFLTAWYLSEKGNCGTAGAVLYRIVMAIYIPIIVFGMSNLKLHRLLPEWGSLDPRLVVGLLLPWTAAESGEMKKTVLVTGATALTASVITSGTISYHIARQYSNGFYEAVRGFRIAGIAERFESVLSMAMTIGWFLTLVLLMKECKENRRKDSTVGKLMQAAVPLGILILCRKPDWQIAAAGSLAVWGVLPLFEWITEKMKKYAEKA